MEEYNLQVRIIKQDLLDHNIIEQPEHFEEFMDFLEDRIEHRLNEQTNVMSDYAEKFYLYRSRKRNRLVDKYSSLLANIMEYPEDSDSEKLRELKDEADRIKWELINFNKGSE